MKLIHRHSLIFIFTLFISVFVSAQKTAFIDISVITSQMPETKTANQKLQEFSSIQQKQIDQMQKDMRAKYDDFNSRKSKLTPDQIEAAGNSFRAMQDKIVDAENTRTRLINQKTTELMSPIINKANAAAVKAAQNKGYTALYDISTNQYLLYPEADNILKDTKTLLGITQ